MRLNSRDNTKIKKKNSLATFDPLFLQLNEYGV